MFTLFRAAPLGPMLLLGLVLVAVALPGTAVAVVPSNDNLAGATVVSEFPFVENVEIVDASTEAGEYFYCNYSPKTVWYSVTMPESGQLRFSNAGSGFYDTALRVYRQDGPGFGGLSFVGCASPWWNGQQTLSISAQAGETYLVQAGNIYSWSGLLRTSIEVVLPPANDDFANAKPVSSLPFVDPVDTTLATVETGEPELCTYGPSRRTAWYSYTPTESGSVMATIPVGSLPVAVAAYTGSSLASLEQAGCRYGGPLTIHVDAGTTYWFQVGSYDQAGGPMRFRLAVAPAPIASFSSWPYDPSMFDSVSFYDYSWDPGGAGIKSRTWDFGDGSSSPLCCPQHRYAQDGDYTVEMTVTTVDGRSASTTRSLSVRTHDVAVERLQVPQNGNVEQTRSITVGIDNARYPETVQVQLYKSVTGTYDRFVLVGTLTQFVPIRNGNKTTPFDFSYTFTADDAAVEKVSFRAVATIVGARDAVSGDNEAIALPTRVNP